MKKFLCKIIGHDYKLLRKINSTIREVECARCKKQFGMNDNVMALIPLDDEIRELHEELLKG